MGYNSSDLLEEILHECYELGIIDEVREEVIKTMSEKKHTRLVDAYEESFYKILNKKNKKPDTEVSVEKKKKGKK